jgi:hypothetical protein
MLSLAFSIIFLVRRPRRNASDLAENNYCYNKRELGVSRNFHYRPQARPVTYTCQRRNSVVIRRRETAKKSHAVHAGRPPDPEQGDNMIDTIERICPPWEKARQEHKKYACGTPAPIDTAQYFHRSPDKCFLFPGAQH